MKTCFTILFLCCFWYVAEAQVQQDTSLTNFIKKKHYTQLSDTAHLQNEIKLYYGSIITAFEKNDLKPDTYYIPDRGVIFSEEVVKVTLVHVESIKIENTFYKKINRATQQMNIWLSPNPSKLDAEVIINRRWGIALLKLTK